MKRFYLLTFLTIVCIYRVWAQSANVTEANDKAEALLNQNPKQSLEIATANKDAADNATDRKGAARALAIMAVANYKIDEYDKAKTLIVDAIKLTEQISDTSNLAFCKYWLGNIELNKGHYSAALDLFQTTDSLAQRIGDKKNLARSLDGKASIYETLNEDDKALEFYNQSLKVAHEANFKEWYGGVTFSLGNLAFKKGKLDDAIAKYSEAITLSDESNNLNNKASCYQQLASVYYEKKDSKQAVKYIQEAMALFQQTGSMSSFSYSRLMMSTILLTEGAYDMSISMAKMSLDEGKMNGEIQLQKNAAEILYYGYLGKGDKGKALDYHVLLHKLSEESNNEELAKRVAKLDMEEHFSKEREIAKAQEEKRVAEMNMQIDRQRLVKKVSFIGIFLLAIIAGLAIFAFLQKRNDSTIIADEKRKTDELLLNILPSEIVNEIKENEYQATDIATVLFANITYKGSSDEKLAMNVVQAETDKYFKAFDDILSRYRIERIKTLSEEYLCIGTSPIRNKESDSAAQVVKAALEMQDFVARAQKEREGSSKLFFNFSIGVHTGPLIVGIIGIRKYSYVVWGDTVNIAARMEQLGEAGKINISGATYKYIKDDFICVARNEVEIKGRERTEMYFVERRA